MNIPKKHHFLPAFYLKQWATGPKSQLVEFSMPYNGIVKPRRTSPEGTGYINRLYAVEGLPDEEAHRFEETFLKPVDTLAATALQAMLDPSAAKSFPYRLEWADFINTLIARMPRDMEMIRNNVKGAWMAAIPGLREKYLETRSATDPETLEDYIEGGNDAFFADSAMIVGRQFMGNDRWSRALAGLNWAVWSFENADFELLTSDRPVLYTNYLNGRDTHLIMPIGPRKAFAVAKERAYLDKMLRENSQSGLVEKLNKVVVESADAYVYGSTDRQLRFVKNRMGRNRQPSLVDRVHAMRMERLAEFEKRLPPPD